MSFALAQRKCVLGFAAVALFGAAPLLCAVSVEIKGRVTNKLTEDQYRAVAVVMTDRLGTEIGRATPNKNGRYEIRVSGPRYIIIKAMLEGYPTALLQLDTEQHSESTSDFEHNEAFGKLRLRTYYQNITFGEPGSAPASAGPMSLEEILAKEDPKAVGEYQKARRQKESGNLDKAVSALEKLVRKYPDFYIGYIDLGMILAARQENDEAIELFAKARELRPEHSWAYVGLGLALNNKQDFKAALGHLEKAVEIEPDSINAEYQLGLAAFRLNNTDRAVSCFHRVIELDPGFNPLAYKMLASIYANKQEPFKAADALESYLANFPEAEDAEKVRAIVARLKPTP